MSLGIQLLLFTLGVILIVKGGDFFVDAAAWIAEVSGVPKFIVGATVVSIATTLPEMIVSIMAALENKTEMAVGNAVGSVTANTGLILSLAIICLCITVERRAYINKILLLLAAATITLISSQGGQLSPMGCGLLLLVFAFFTYDNIQGARKMRDDDERPRFNKRDLCIHTAKFIFGAAGIVIGSDFLLDSGSLIALRLGVPDGIIAVTMVAIGTSLPELVTTLTAIIKKQSALSVGNIIGANVMDLSLILPLCSIVSGRSIPVDKQGLLLDMPACLIVLIIAFIPTLFSQKLAKWQGLLMLAFYCAYVYIVCTAQLA